MEIPSVPATACSYPLRAGNKVAPLVDSYHFYERIGEAIANAKYSIWIVVSFIRTTHQIPYMGKLSLIWDVLDEAVSRGIDVRILFWRNTDFSLGNTTIFNGTKEDFEMLRKRRSTFLVRWDNSNDPAHCHHEKTWLFDVGHDTEVTFTGGIVLSGGLSTKGHKPSEMARQQIHDIMLEISGPACTDVQHSFVQRWNEASDRLNVNGCWPNSICANDLPFPLQLVPRTTPIGSSLVQIQRTIRSNSYTMGFPPPEGQAFNISDGEASIYEQYKLAIQSAKDTIYIENQHIAHDYLIKDIIDALKRGVVVLYLVPGQGIGAAQAVRHKVDEWRQYNYYNGEIITFGAPPPPKYGSIFLEALPLLSKFPNFCLAALAHQSPQGISHVYVHSKLMIVDNKWFTIGSANFVDISFEKDHTELNASVWDPMAATSLLYRLVIEHSAKYVSHMTPRDLLLYCQKLATENLEKLKHGEIMQGNLFLLDPLSYCLPITF